MVISKKKWPEDLYEQDNLDDMSKVLLQKIQSAGRIVPNWGEGLCPQGKSGSATNPMPNSDYWQV